MLPSLYLSGSSQTFCGTKKLINPAVAAQRKARMAELTAEAQERQSDKASLQGPQKRLSAMTQLSPHKVLYAAPREGERLAFVAKVARIVGLMGNALFYGHGQRSDLTRITRQDQKLGIIKPKYQDS